MVEFITCPACQSRLQFPESLAGHQVQCPKCGATFSAAGPEPAPLIPKDLEDEAVVKRRPRYEDDYYDEYPDRDYSWWSRRFEPHRGSTILVLGILSLVMCGPILGPIAWIMGQTDMNEIRSGRMHPDGEGLTNAGRICGMIATILSIVGLAIWGTLFFAAVLTARPW
jgi:hypothetical protein